MIFGEITTRSQVNFQDVVRATIKSIGYDSSEKGFDYNTCNVMNAIEPLSPDIAQGLHYDKADEELYEHMHGGQHRPPTGHPQPVAGD